MLNRVHLYIIGIGGIITALMAILISLALQVMTWAPMLFGSVTWNDSPLKLFM